MPLASDEHLVSRVRGGSTAAFDTLFNRHHRPLLAFCRRMLGSAADAEDAVQHTFMAAYADLMRSDKPIHLRPWLYSIARNRCLSVLRAQRERPVDELPEPSVDHLAAEVDVREELRATLADIARLPEDQRAALVLAELGDASHGEIAEMLECRHDKVKALVFQARATLATGRTARDTPCIEIREELSAGGVGLRRPLLRQHVRDCAGCRAFAEQARLQRRRLRVLLPWAPLLGLKRAVLGLVSAGGGGAAAVTTAGIGGLAATATAIAWIGVTGPRPAPVAPVAEKRAPLTQAAAPRRATAVRGVRPAAPAPAKRTRPTAPPSVRRQQRRVTRPERSPARTVPAPAPPPAGTVAPAAPGTVAPPAPRASEPTQPITSRRPAQPPGLEHARGRPETPPAVGKPAEPPGKGAPPVVPPGTGPPEEHPGRGNGPPPGVSAGPGPSRR